MQTRTRATRVSIAGITRVGSIATTIRVAQYEAALNKPNRINQASKIAGLFLWALEMAFKFINNFETTLTGDITAAATSMTVASAAGLSLASGEVYRLTIQNADASLYELVDVTAISGNTLTIERGKESTTAQAWASGSTVLCGVTAEQLDKLNSSGSGSSSETWYTATSNTLNIANGSKQKRTLTANATLAFTLSDGDDITLILNPSTFTVMWPTITWFGSAPVLTASKEHTIVISKDGSVLRGWWQVAV